MTDIHFFHDIFDDKFEILDDMLKEKKTTNSVFNDDKILSYLDKKTLEDSYDCFILKLQKKNKCKCEAITIFYRNFSFKLVSNIEEEFKNKKYYVSFFENVDSRCFIVLPFCFFNELYMNKRICFTFIETASNKFCDATIPYSMKLYQFYTCKDFSKNSFDEACKENYDFPEKSIPSFKRCSYLYFNKTNKSLISEIDIRKEIITFGFEVKFASDMKYEYYHNSFIHHVRYDVEYWNIQSDYDDDDSIFVNPEYGRAALAILDESDGSDGSESILKYCVNESDGSDGSWDSIIKYPAKKRSRPLSDSEEEERDES